MHISFASSRPFYSTKPFSASAPGAVEYTQFVLEMKLQLGYPIRRVEGRVLHVFALIDPRGHAQKSNRRSRRTRY